MGDVAPAGPGGPEPSQFRKLWRVPRLRALLVAQMAGQAADGFAQISFAQLVLFEAGRGATPGALAALLAVTLLPFSLVGPVAGVLIDRFDRRRVLVVASLARVGIVVSALPMLATRAEVPAYVAVLALLSTSRFVLAAKGAALPQTIGAQALVPANALSAIAGMVAGFAGAVAGSSFVHRAPAAGFVTAAALYGGAALVWSRLGALGGGYRPAPARHAVRRVVGEVLDGARFVARVPAVRSPLLAVAAYRVLLGAGFVVLVLLADERYELEAPGYGLALAATGVGAFVGSVVAPRLSRNHDPASLLPAAFPLGAAAAFVGGFFPSLPVLVSALGGAACAFQAMKVLADAVIQRASPDEVRGRVFAAYDILYNVAFVAAALLLVPLWRADRDQMLLWGIAIGLVAAGALLARARRTWPFTSLPRECARVVHAWRWRAAAMLAAAPLTFAFPETNWWWLGWVGLVPLFLVVRAAPTVREAGWRAWAGGTAFVVAAQHWLVPNIGPALLLLGVLIGAAWVPCGWLVRGLLGGRPSMPSALAACALVPAAWTAAEFVRSWEALGGPWALLGASQWAQPGGALALASLGGVWLVSAALVAANVAVTAFVAAAGSPRAVLILGLAAAVIAAGPVWAAMRPLPGPSGSVRVLGAQPGVTEGPAARFDASESATLGGIEVAPDLVVWGESSVGFDFARRPDLLARVVALADAAGADVLVNTDARRAEGGIFKSAVLVGPDGVRGRYDKMRLVPFGEYIPLRFALGWLAAFTRAADEDRGRGARLVLLETAGIRVGPLVCFELSFPDLTRRLAADGADLIVVQSATSTFQESWAPEQHASLAALRAVETGRPVLHATLTGVSAAFDATGRELLWFGTGRRGAYTVEIPLAQGTTVYTRLGDWTPAAAFAGLLAAAALRLVRAARPARRPGEPAEDA